MTDKIPLVSVIIPMFNSAKFITQTLESLAYQTMQDFEVVVIDDCSTDNSVEIVEKFSERFDGRLHVIKLPENTGTPGLPRNVGIQFARGKYIAFLDSDDLYTKTALEELTTLAEQYQADVVHSYNSFMLWDGKEHNEDDPAMTDFAELTNPKNFNLVSRLKENLTEPVLETEDIGERVKKWLSMPANEFWALCLLFYRRDFLITSQNFFPSMLTCEDMTVAFLAMCLAKKCLKVANATYIVRPRIGSVSRDRPTIERHIHKRIRALNDGFNEFERIMNKIDFFNNRPDYRYAVLKWFANYRIALMLPVYTQNPLFKLNELVKKEFHPDDAVLSAYLFNTVNIQRLELIKQQQENTALKKKLQKHSLQLIELQQDNVTLKKELQKYRSEQ